jgi:hypothetical protein
MTDLSNAIVTDFTEREWKYLDKKQRKQVEGNTPKHVLRVWRGERYDSKTSLKWTTWVFVIIPLIFFVICGALLLLAKIADDTAPVVTPAQKLEALGPHTDVNADGRPCNSGHCEGGYATLLDWAKANQDNPRAASILNAQ